MALNCSSLSVASSTAPSVPPLSSASSSFLTSSASTRMLTPISSMSHTPMRMRASITCRVDPDQQDVAASRPTSKAILTGLLATGAALSVFAADIVSTPAPAHAFFGPFTGKAGEEAVAKSKDILKSADKLDVSGMSGPGKVSGTASNSAAPGALSQKISSSIKDDSGKRDQNVFGTGPGNALQNAGNQIANKVGEKKGDLMGAADNVMGKAKSVTNSGDLKGAADKAVGQAKSAAGNVMGQAKDVTNTGDLKGAADKAVGQTKSKAGDAMGMAKGKADSAGDAMGMAKSKADSVASSPGTVLGAIKEGVQNLNSDATKALGGALAGAKNSAGDTANKVQSSMSMQ